MIKLLSTDITVKPDNDQEYLEVLGEIEQRMMILGIKTRSLSYRIRPDDNNKVINITTLDLQEHVN